MFRKCLAPLTAGALLFATSVSGAPQSLTFPDKADSVVVPVGSPLHFRAFKAGDTDTAEFTGKILLSGTYYILGGDELSMIFVPDDATVTRLPHLKKHSGEDTVTIGISNFAPSQARHFRRRR